MAEVANQGVQLEQTPNESERREAIEDFIIQLYASYDIPADRYPWLHDSLPDMRGGPLARG